MITTFEGPMGSSKTLSAVALLQQDYAQLDRKIISNVWLSFPHQEFDLKFFVANLETTEMSNCSMLWDETYQMMDSRSGMTKMSKLMTYFVVQTRKLNVDLYVCTHHIDHIDKRLRRAVDVRGTCQFIKEKPCKRCGGTGIRTGDEPKNIWGEPYPKDTCGRCLGSRDLNDPDGPCTTGFSYTVLLNRRARDRSSRIRRLSIPAPLYWPLYDTTQRVHLTTRQRTISVEELI